MVVRNTGNAPDRLVGASCTCAAMVMAHRTTTVNGVSSMTMEHSVEVPAKGAVAFTPAGRHLMITGVKSPIAAGTKVPIVLQFEKAGRMPVAFTATATPGMGEHP
jgi:copper(I)-binding protein